MVAQQEYDYLFKIIITGEEATGKSNLLQAYVADTFSEAYISTIGVDFMIKNVTQGVSNVKLQMWDTGGQERFQAITKSYYRAANAVVIAFDITNRESF